MKNPGTPEQLADAIESLVASYMDEVRLAAQRAVERSLTRGAAARAPSKGAGPRRAVPKSDTKRRNQTELDEVCEELCKLVRARPGEAMTTLAEEMGMPMSALQRPMAKLRTEGRVRCVGQRHLMRYFPAVLRAAAGKE
jgi:predicted Rossmann fold nucleotide-binding protein DprA/Smf involved in DNA uptake